MTGVAGTGAADSAGPGSVGGTTGPSSAAVPGASGAPVLPIDLGSGPAAIETRGLVKRFGAVVALNGLRLRVPEGAVYVLVGPNGAGKTTLLRLLMSLTGRDAGDATVLGFAPGSDGPSIRARTGYVPEGHAFGYSWMTVGRLLEHTAVYFPTWDAAYARDLIEAYDIDLTRKCGAMSKGQSRRVQLVLALAHRPSLLLLDDGLDHVIRDETLRILSRHLSDTATTMLISTHRVYEVERLVDHVGVLSDGKLLGQLPRMELQRMLRRYWADVPEGWDGAAAVNGHIIDRRGGARDIEWTVWGEEDRVVAGLSAAGASVRNVAPLSIDEAATALLSRREAS